MLYAPITVLPFIPPRDDTMIIAPALRALIPGATNCTSVIAAMVSHAFFDPTGIIALASGLVVATAGLLVLPNQRRKAKRELHKKMQDLRDGLEHNLSKQFDDELVKASDKLNNAISPYTRFIRSELGRLEELQTELTINRGELSSLKREIDNLH